MDSQEKLNSLLINIANNGLEPPPNNVGASFNDIYKDDFRHIYSDLARIILSLKPEQRDYLSESLSLIFNSIEKLGLTDDAKAGLKKLNDHVNLEIIRAQHFMRQSDYKMELNEQIKRLIELRRVVSIDLEEMENHIEAIELNIMEVDENFKKANTQSMAVLSVFTAILMGFTGGFTLLGSAFTRMVDANIFRLLMTVFAVGFVLYNVIYMVLHVSAKIYQVDIRSACKNIGPCPNESTHDHPKCNPHKRVKKRYPVFYWTNIGILILFILTGLTWLINNNFDSILNTIVTISTSKLV